MAPWCVEYLCTIEGKSVLTRLFKIMYPPVGADGTHNVPKLNTIIQKYIQQRLTGDVHSVNVRVADIDIATRIILNPLLLMGNPLLMGNHLLHI